MDHDPPSVRNLARRVRRIAACIAVSLAAVPVSRGQAQRAGVADSSARAEEAAYARSIQQVADSAIHGLDFFPARAQLRMQMLFMTSRDSLSELFYLIGHQSIDAAMSMNEIAGRFQRVRAPADLDVLHRALVSSLHDAQRALDRLASAATACQADIQSVSRCQTPFTAASGALDRAYHDYVDARLRIAAQILDTDTRLPALGVARRPAPRPPR